jgi:hypothetical protein
LSVSFAVAASGEVVVANSTKADAKQEHHNHSH